MQSAKQTTFFIILITTFLISPFKSSAQTFTEYYFGGPNNSDKFNDVKNTDTGSLAFGYTTSPEDHHQFYLVKFSEAGSEEWSLTYGTGVNAIGKKILVLADGYLLAGTTEPVNQLGAKDIYLIRVDETGNILWEQTYGVSDDDFFGDIILDNDGNFAVTGGSVINETVGEEIFLKLINGEGVELWTQYYGSPDAPDRGTCLVTDLEGNYLLGGVLGGESTVLSVAANTQSINWMISPNGGNTDFKTVEDITYFPNGTDLLLVGTSVSDELMVATLLPNGNITATQIYEVFSSSDRLLSSVTLRDDVFNILATKGFFDKKNVVRLDTNLLNLGSFEIADNNTEINAIEITPDGNFITVGSTRNLSIDALVRSYNFQGDFLWEQTLGQLEKSNLQVGFAIEPTLDSGFVFTESKRIYKLNKELEIDWMTEFSESSNPWSVIQSPDLNYYVLKTVGNDRFLQKLNIDGIQIWEIDINDYSSTYPHFGKVINLVDGNLLTLFSGPVYQQIANLKKISPEGDIRWTKELNLADQTRAYSAIETSDNNLVVCGVIKNPGEDYKGFLAKVDQSGNLIWHKNYAIEEHFSRLFTRLYETENSDLIIIGTGLDEGGTFPLLFKTDADGNELSRQTFGGDDGTHWAYDIAPVSVNNNDQIAFTSTYSPLPLPNDPQLRSKNREARLTIINQDFDLVSTQIFGVGSAPVFYDLAVSLDGKIAALGHAYKGTWAKAYLVSTEVDGIGTNTFDFPVSNALNVFPNPSNGIINLELDNANNGILEIKLHDSRGQELWGIRETKNRDTFVKTLDFSFLPKGQYFISVLQDEQIWSKQWLKTEN